VSDLLFGAASLRSEERNALCFFLFLTRVSQELFKRSPNGQQGNPLFISNLIQLITKIITDFTGSILMRHRRKTLHFYVAVGSGVPVRGVAGKKITSERPAVPPAAWRIFHFLFFDLASLTIY